MADTDNRRIAATYDYRDGQGEPLFQVVRYDPKGFSQRRPDGNGGWIWNLEGVRRVLYRYPELLAADPDSWVLIAEGEKDADRLAELGFVATTNPGGADKWRKEYSEVLRSLRVCILRDNDEAGRNHAARVAQSLHGIAAEIRVLELPRLPVKGDASDWLDAGGTRVELERLIGQAPRWEPGEADQGGGNDQRSATPTVNREPVGVLASEVEPERITWLWRGRLALGKPTMLDGDPELGKTTLALDCAARISRGRALPGDQSGEPRGVVILSAEDGLSDTIVPRLEVADADLGKVFIMTGVRVPEGDTEAVTLPGGLDAVEQAIRAHDAALLVVDPLMAYLGADVNSNRDQDVRRAMAPLAAMLERTGCSGLLLRHLNKGAGGQPLYRGGGSIGIIGAARVGLLLAKDPEDEAAHPGSDEGQHRPAPPSHALPSPGGPRHPRRSRGVGRGTGHGVEREDLAGRGGRSRRGAQRGGRGC